VAFAAAVVVAIRVILGRGSPAKPRRKVYPNGIYGARKLADLILDGSEKQFVELFRMEKRVFTKLADWLIQHAGLRASKFESAEQKLIVIL
jgi:hypothetical protein